MAADIFKMLRASKSFSGFVMKGMYDISIDDVELAYRHYEKTGENTLDEHAQITHLRWDIGRVGNEFGPSCADVVRRNKLLMEKILIGLSFWDVSDSFRDVVRDVYRSGIKQIADEEEYVFRRAQASKAIQKKDIRISVFARDEGRCRRCGSTKNLSVDHIIPVKNGGTDDMDNLQTLCRKCNSQKGCR